MGDVHTVAPASVEGAGMRVRLGGYFPILSWGPRYPRAWFGRDAIAGLTLWGLVVPEGMAYAGIADLPPQAGLYTLVVSLAIYALMGTSRHLAVGPTSATAALLASSVTTAVIATAGDAGDPGTYAASAAAFVLVTGVVFLVAGMLRLGFVTQFLSKPVMDGFVMGLAIFVAVGQLNKLFGVEKPEGNTVQKLVGILKELPEANWVSFAIGAVSLVVLFALPRVNPRASGWAGVVLFGTILVSKWLDLEGTQGVEVVGALPQGLPSLTFTAVPGDLPGDGAAGHGGVPRRVHSELAGRRVRRQARLRGGRQPGAQRPRCHELSQPVVRRASSPRGACPARRSRTPPTAGREPGHLGGHGHNAAVLHAAVRHPSRGRARRSDHPCGLAPHRLAEAAHLASGVADRVLVRASGDARRAAHRRAGGHDHRPGRRRWCSSSTIAAARTLPPLGGSPALLARTPTWSGTRRTRRGAPAC